jgi:GNAT superfamily N-acetyltransferase
LSTSYHIRPATTADVDTLVDFTLEEAREAEGLRADETAVRRGVAAAFADPPRSCYWIAEDASGTAVASTSVVKEWSDFRGGDYWWIQSVFITAPHRGRGVLELVIDHVAKTARAAGALDLRLYAHRSNERALRAYRRCGFSDAPYVIMTFAKAKPQPR